MALHPPSAGHLPHLLDLPRCQRYHLIHHTTYKHNYGHYFIYFDKICELAAGPSRPRRSRPETEWPPPSPSAVGTLLPPSEYNDKSS